MKRIKRIQKERTKRLVKINRLHDIVWGYMSRYVRLRDESLGCITCKAPVSYEEGQAGHLWHGANMDFLHANINKQCVRCNKFLHGNTGVYVLEVDKKWGSGTAERLLAEKNVMRKYSREELEDIKQNLENRIAQLMAEKVLGE
jgi:hypothetical protein